MGNLLGIAITSFAIGGLLGLSFGELWERRRCRLIVDALSNGNECCGNNYDSENDTTVGPCCGVYYRRCDGAAALRMIDGGARPQTPMKEDRLCN